MALCSIVLCSSNDHPDGVAVARERLLRRRQLLCRHRLTAASADGRIADRQCHLQLHAELDV